nr:hypothetical protein [uncultured Niameybacter sp.]
MVEVLEFLESIGGAWEQVGEILEILMGIYLLVGGILALVQCFFGYKLLKLWIALIGGVFGGSLALLIGLVQGAGDRALFYFIVGAIIGGFLAFKVYLIGVFFIGVLGGIMTAIILGIMMELGSGIIGLALILGIVGGIAVLILQKPAIIIATSLGTGMQLVGIIGMLLDNTMLGILLGGIITCIGMWYQFTSGKAKKPVVSEVAVAALPVVEVARL